MAKGYHSRSPEELKKYLESLNQKSKKRNWIQIFIFIDILIILFAFYHVAKNFSPDFEKPFQPSNKIISGSNEMYFLKSNESTETVFSYFVFVKNLSEEEKKFPTQKEKIFFSITNQSSENCLSKEIDFKTKKISAKQKEFFSFEINESEIKEIEECKNFFKKQEYRGFGNFFNKKKSNYFTELNLIEENKIFKMRLKNGNSN